MLLSVVATSRNDDHGGNALWRTQHFVDGLAHQAKKHQVSIELVLVDWNPLSDRVGLFEALKWPKADKYFQYRVIVVPNEYHTQFKASTELPLFQYLAKNVGIRRAKGDFILATNIDILFSDELFAFFKSGLKKGFLYRVDRFDIDDKILDGAPFEEILSYAEKNILRVNAAFGTVSYRVYKGLYCSRFKTLKFSFRMIKWVGYVFLNLVWKIIRDSLRNIILSIVHIICFILKMVVSFCLRLISVLMTDSFRGLKKRSSFGGFKNKLYSFIRHIKSDFKKLTVKFHNLSLAFLEQLLVVHTNACGDFTLMSKDDWYALKAYPEWDIFSWHIDSVLLYQAYYSHIKMHNLSYKHPIYHIEHGKGSGFTPEYANLLFGRLNDKGVEYLNNQDLQTIIFDQYQQSHNRVTISYNSDDWGAFREIFSENMPTVDLKKASA